MSRHRLTADSTVTYAAFGTDSRSRRPGRHRVVTPPRTSMPVRIGAAAAFAGALGLAGAAAGEAAAAPSSGSSSGSSAASLLDGVQLPQELNDLLGGLLPSAPGQGQGRAVKPCNGTVSSGYGPRWGTNHNGVDIAAPMGTPVYAVTDGTVLEAGPASGYGQWVRVQQDDGTTGIFGHVEQMFVRAGQKVRAGQQIATVGNRGQSTGPHLHYEVWNAAGNPIDPNAWLNKRGVHL